eukprot:627726_1
MQLYSVLSRRSHLLQSVQCQMQIIQSNANHTIKDIDVHNLTEKEIWDSYNSKQKYNGTQYVKCGYPECETYFLQKHYNRVDTTEMHATTRMRLCIIIRMIFRMNFLRKKS